MFWFRNAFVRSALSTNSGSAIICFSKVICRSPRPRGRVCMLSADRFTCCTAIVFLLNAVWSTAGISICNNPELYSCLYLRNRLLLVVETTSVYTEILIMQNFIDGNRFTKGTRQVAATAQWKKRIIQSETVMLPEIKFPTLFFSSCISSTIITSYEISFLKREICYLLVYT